jgi:hypothetical protein
MASFAAIFYWSNSNKDAEKIQKLMFGPNIFIEDHVQLAPKQQSWIL